MIASLVKKTVFRFGLSHSFYSPNTLEYPINLAE
jgi:hypothetical protein